MKITVKIDGKKFKITKTKCLIIIKKKNIF